jgi:hypothetical protein
MADPLGELIGAFPGNCCRWLRWVQQTRAPGKSPDGAAACGETRGFHNLGGA